MKYLILASLIALSSPALANTGDTTPTGMNVQFDVLVQVSVCTLDSKGAIVQCNASNDPKPFEESMSDELVHSECYPACTYNDSASFGKTYKLKANANGAEVSADLSVWFNRMSGILDPSVTDYTVQASLNPSTGDASDDRASLTSVKDLAALNSVYVSGKKIRKTLADGSVYELQPYAILNHFKIVKK